MKSLVLAGECPDTANFSRGYHHAFLSLDYVCELLRSGENYFERFEKFSPDLVWADSRNLTRGVVKALIEFKPKLILFVSDYDNASEEEKEHVEKLKNGGYDLFFNTSFCNRIKEKTEKWNTRVLSCLPAADTTEYYEVESEDEFSFNKTYIGWYNFRKAEFLKQKLLGLSGLNIFGYGLWPVYTYAGSVNIDSMRKIICGSQFNLSAGSLTSPSERVFKIMACGRTPFVYYEDNEYLNTFDGMIHHFDSKTNKSFNDVARYIKEKHSYKLRLSEILENL
jgi:hypothetical protein